MPRSTFAAQAQYLVHSGLPLLSNPRPTAGHFVCTGAVLRAFGVFWSIVHFPCARLFLMHRRSTSCILGCHSLPTLLRPRVILYAQAQCFVHLVCFYQLRISRAPGYFDAQAQYFVHSGLPPTSNSSLTVGYFHTQAHCFVHF